jgi:hypothetical protein
MVSCLPGALWHNADMRPTGPCVRVRARILRVVGNHLPGRSARWTGRMFVHWERRPYAKSIHSSSICRVFCSACVGIRERRERCALSMSMGRLSHCAKERENMSERLTSGSRDARMTQMPRRVAHQARPSLCSKSQARCYPRSSIPFAASPPPPPSASSPPQASNPSAHQKLVMAVKEEVEVRALWPLVAGQEC